jgi:hypothetical protein
MKRSVKKPGDLTRLLRGDRLTLRASDEEVRFGETGGDGGLGPVHDAVAMSGIGTSSRNILYEFPWLYELIGYKCALLIAKPPKQLAASARVTVPARLTVAVTLRHPCRGDLFRRLRAWCVRW